METLENGEKEIPTEEIYLTRKNEYQVYPQLLAGLTATLTIFSAGMGFNWPAVALPKLIDENSEGHLTFDEGAWMVSALSMGACVGPVLSSLFVDRIGRKWFLYLCGVPYLVCWILIYLSQSFPSLFVARFIYGVGVGAAFGVVPMYLGEIAEDRIRGALGCMIGLNLSVGGLIVYCVGPWASDETMAIVNTAPTILLFVAFLWMPESPYYYLKKNRPLEAEKSLSWLRKSTDIEEELKNMSASVEHELNNRGKITELMTVPGNRRATLIVFLLIAGQQFSGMVGFMSYATLLFEKSGLKLDPNYGTIMMGAASALSSIGATSVIDKLGKKPLYLTSSFGTSLCLFVLGLYFYLEQNDVQVDVVSWVPLASAILLQLLFALGLGPIPYAVVAEIYPINVKALATMVVSIYGSFLGVIISKLYQVLADTYGYSVLFLSLCICEVLFAVLVMIFLPETKGKSLREIQQIMNKDARNLEITAF